MLTDPQGRPLGNPVVAHIISLGPGATDEDVRAIARYWQQVLGVPAMILMPGMRLIGAVHADGTLQELPPDDDLTTKVQVVLGNNPNNN